MAPSANQQITQPDFTVEDYVEKARVLRALAMRRLFTRAAVLNAVVSMMTGWVAGLAAVWRRAALRRELEALDDRLLADIGLRRDQIPDVVNAAFRGHADASPTVAGEIHLAALVGGSRTTQAKAAGDDRLVA